MQEIPRNIFVYCEHQEQKLLTCMWEFNTAAIYMIMIYKITHGISGCPFENFFTINSYMSTRNNGLKFYKHHSHLNVRKHSFSQRVINDWNTLPSDIIQSPNVSLFKKRLDEHWHQFRLILN